MNSVQIMIKQLLFIKLIGLIFVFSSCQEAPKKSAKADELFQIQERKHALEQKEKELKKIREKLEKGQEELNQKWTEYREQQKRAVEQESEFQNLKKELKNKEHQVTEEQKKLEQKRTEFQNLERELKKRENQILDKQKKLEQQKIQLQNQEKKLKERENHLSEEKKQLELQKEELQVLRLQLDQKQKELTQKKTEDGFYIIALDFNAGKQEQPAILFGRKNRSLFFKNQGECVKLKKSDFLYLEILMIETEEKFNFPRVYNVLCSFRRTEDKCKANSYSITRTPDGKMPYSIQVIESIDNVSNCEEVELAVPEKQS